MMFTLRATKTYLSAPAVGLAAGSNPLSGPRRSDGSGGGDDLGNTGPGGSDAGVLRGGLAGVVSGEGFCRTTFQNCNGAVRIL